MATQTKEQLEREYWETKWAIATKHPWSFIRDFANTFDEHEEDGVLALDKPFPDKAIYRILTRAWWELKIVFIEKSRQVMMTWLMAALFLWLIMFRPATRIFFSSKKDEDAQKIVGRAKHIYERLAKMNLPGLPVPRMVGGAIGTTTTLEFPALKSSITAIPQGPDQVRSLVWSGGLGDESEYQVDFDEAYGAVAPALDENSRYFAVSSVNGENICYYILHGIDEITGELQGPHIKDSDRIKPTLTTPPDHYNSGEKRRHVEKVLMEMSDEEFDAIPFDELVAECPGMRYWETSIGSHSMSVHYTADPDKDPATPEGKDWKEKAFKRFKTRRQWDKEMEMRRNVYDGQPVIPNWSHSLFVRSLEYDSEYPILMGIDFGTQVCGAIIAQYVRIPDFNAYQLRILREVILKGLSANTPNLTDDIVALMNGMYLRSWRNGNIQAFCDPNGDRQSATTSDISLNSSIKIMNASGLYPSSKKYAVKESTECLETAFSMTLPNGEPAIVVDPECEYLISCYEGGLHFPKKKAGKRQGKEGHYEKDGIFDHGGDMTRYLVANIFTEYILADKPEPTIKRTGVYGKHKWTGERIKIRRNLVHRGDHAVRSDFR